MLVFDPDRTCIMKPLFHGSSFYEFSCGKAAFVAGESFPKDCPFCGRPINSLVEPEPGPSSEMALLTWYRDFAVETVGYSAAALGTCALANVFSWVDHRLWLAMMAFTVSAWGVGVGRYFWGRWERERRGRLLVLRAVESMEARRRT